MKTVTVDAKTGEAVTTTPVGLSDEDRARLAEMQGKMAREIEAKIAARASG